MVKHTYTNSLEGCVCVPTKSLQLCPTLCDPMDCSPPDSSVHGILQARILEWVAMASSRGSSRPRDRNHVSYISYIGRWTILQCHLGSPVWKGKKAISHVSTVPESSSSPSVLSGSASPRDEFSSVQFSHSVITDSLRPHESQHARPPCPSPTPGVHSNSRPWSQ